MLDKKAKGPSPALVDTEGALRLRLDRTMGTGPAVAHVFSGLEFFRVVLDFLFGCHNLEVYLHWGTRHDRSTVWRGPFFHLPTATKYCDRRRAKKNGAGSHFEKNEGGVKAGQPGRRGSVSKRNETNKQSPSQIICGLATTSTPGIAVS
jgi:hypothetical protein